MHLDFGIILPLWAFAAGDDDLLERAVGEVGVSHITVPVVTGPTTRYRLHSGGGPHYFHTEGGWHFPPRGELYRSHAARPHAAGWFGRKNVLTKLADEAARRGVPWIARIDPRSAPALLAHAPHLATVNEWGEAELGGKPCVLNPELGELLHELVEDLKGYDVGGVELAGWTLSATRPVRFSAGGWDAQRQRLLDLCFCPFCRRVADAAGADADATARSVQVELGRLLASDEPPRAIPDALIMRYAAAREQDARNWLTRFARQIPGKRFLSLHLPGTLEFGGPPAEWNPLRILEHEPIATVLAEAADSSNAVSIPSCRPWVGSPDALFTVVRAAAASGVRFFDFAGADESTPEAVDWIRRAVRFVHREFDQ